MLHQKREASQVSDGFYFKVSRSLETKLSIIISSHAFNRFGASKVKFAAPAKLNNTRTRANLRATA